MTHEFDVRYCIITSSWDIYQDGKYTGTSFMTEQEAVNFCNTENLAMKKQEA